MTPEEVQRRREEIERLKSKARALAGSLPDPFDVYDKDGKFVCKKEDKRKLTIREFLRKPVIMGYTQPMKLWEDWERVFEKLYKKGLIEFEEIPAGSDSYFFTLTPAYYEWLEKAKAKEEEDE